MTDENVVDINEAKRGRGRPRKPRELRFNWSADLMVDGQTGKIINGLPNAIRCFELAPELIGSIGLDEMTGQVTVRRPLPTANTAAGRGADRTVDDGDLILLQEWIQLEAGWVSLSKSTLTDAIMAVARANRFHPVREYLGALVWDGKPRVPTWLSRYCGADNTEYARAAGVMWLISAVARVFHPGCQADYMIVLTGEQGLQKSSALRVLGGKWFSDQLPNDLSAKDASIALNGKWIIEAAEMASMRRADVDHLKAFITRRTEHFRPPFERFAVEVPRQCVFAGTLNPEGSGFLHDPTGGRRFWPIACGQLSLSALRAERDQLWAEAVSLFRDGVQWWPERDFESKHFKPVQDAAAVVDPWEDVVSEYLEGRSKVEMREIAIHGLLLPIACYDKRAQSRIASVLSRLGWRKGPKNPKTRRQEFVPVAKKGI